MGLITATGKTIARLCDTAVKVKLLTTDVIDRYSHTGEWRGKAGGYAVQGHAAAFVAFLGGSHSNVIGLSLYDIMGMLTGAGFFGPAPDNPK
mgnify:FL=1